MHQVTDGPKPTMLLEVRKFQCRFQMSRNTKKKKTLVERGIVQLSALYPGERFSDMRIPFDIAELLVKVT